MNILICEGNIGAGKSVLCKYLQRKSEGRAIALYEQVNPKLLDAFYKEMKKEHNKYAFTFQLHMLESRSNGNMLQIMEAENRRPNGKPTPSVALLDRSLIGDLVFCLANYLIRGGGIDDQDLDIYLDMIGCSGVKDVHHIFEKRYGEREWNLLYLHSPASECKRRAEQRDGSEKKNGVPLWYYELLEQVYFNIVMQLRNTHPEHVHVSTWAHYSRQNGIYNDTMHIVANDTGSAVEKNEGPDFQCRLDNERVIEERLVRVGLAWYSSRDIHQCLESWAMTHEHS